MNVLVAGGAGYIGSYCCKLLKSKGYNPVVVDNLSTGFRRLARWGVFEWGELSDAEFLSSVFRRHDIHLVMHFAANALVGESVLDPEKYYRNNVCATLNLLGTMRKHGVRSFIFSSTAAIFGNPVQLPIREDHPKAPINPYGQSKLMVENILEDFNRSYQFNYVSFRYFNAAGADPDGETGELHDPETHIIPLAFQAALGLRDHVDLYGTDYPTPDGTCLRDYIHVADLAEAHVRAVDWLAEGRGSMIFNLGNERGFSVREIVELAAKISGRRIPVREAPRRPGDPAELVADSSRAREALAWKPRFSSIETILESAWRWHRAQAEG